MIPKSGYVSIGTVINTVKPIKYVTFKVNQTEIKMSALNSKATNMFHDEEDLEKCEYVVKVKWLPMYLRRKLIR